MTAPRLERGCGLALGAAAVTLWAGACTAAPGEGSAVDATTSASLRGGAWSSTRNLDERESVYPLFLWLKSTADGPGGLRAYAEGWAGSRVDGLRDRAVLREAYVQAEAGWADLRVGRQIVAWGRADKLNPTDNLTPRDFRLLTVEDDDQRTGRDAARVSAYLGSYSLSAWWLPRADNRNRLPNPSDLPYRDRAARDDAAVKLDFSGGRIDWSLSYYAGMDPATSLEAVPGPGGRPLPVLDNRRIHVWGADAAAAWGSAVLRAEAAYVLTEDRAGRDPLVKNPYAYLVAGAERKIAGEVSVNAQVFAKRVFRFADTAGPGVPPTLALQSRLVGDQRDRDRTGYLLRLGRRWLNDTLDGELALLQSFPRRDSLLRAKLVYAFSGDVFRISLGADRFGGPADSFYGRLRGNTAAYLMLSASR